MLWSESHSPHPKRTFWISRHIFKNNKSQRIKGLSCICGITNKLCLKVNASILRQYKPEPACLYQTLFLIIVWTKVKLLREFSVIFLGNSLLVLLAWRVYGQRIRNKFMSGRQVCYKYSDKLWDKLVKGSVGNEKVIILSIFLV